MAKIKKAKKYLLRSNAYHFDRRYLYNWRVERSLKVLTPPKCQFYDGIFYQVVFSRSIWDLKWLLTTRACKLKHILEVTICPLATEDSKNKQELTQHSLFTK